MSGGSYNYLCYVNDVESLGKSTEDLQRMEDTLRDLAARHRDNPAVQMALHDTEDVATLMRAALARARAMEKVWHAVEWRDSRDWGDDDMFEAIEEWYRERPGG